MVDSVLVICPSCENAVDLKSRAGACAGSIYPCISVPMSIAVDLEEHLHNCRKCPAILRIRIVNPVNVAVSVSVI